MATQVGADAFYSQGYTGTSAIVANVEAGHIFGQHQTLDDRVPHRLEFPGLSPIADDAHATQVAGVIAADGFLNGGAPSSTGPGIAHGATLWSGRIATQVYPNGSFDISGNSFLWPLMVAGDVGLKADGTVGGPGAVTAQVINSSWGFNDDTGNTVIHATYDYLANARGVTVVVAAGNAGQGAGSVGGPANAWNVIAVGATAGTGDLETVTSFSSGGPTGSFGLAGTRTKPDIVAPGTLLLMPTTGGTDAFAYGSGTSFASPVVAGGAALMIDYAQQTGRSTDPRLIKALLLTGARKLDGWSQEIHLHPTTGTRINATPLDAGQGAGRIDLAATLDVFSASTGQGTSGAVGLKGWHVGQVSQGAPIDYVFQTPLEAGWQLTASLVWFMDRAVEDFNAASSNPFATTQFFNDSFDDLDLFLYRADGAGLPLGDPVAASISGWKPGSPNAPGLGLDSVEHLRLTVPATDTYLLRVVWRQELFDFVGDPNTEDFALAWAVVPEPSSLVLALLAVFLAALAAGRRLRRTP